jgi:hypothetical protein
MEVPVASALGLVDAYNLGDGLAADYARYYDLLNCGLKISASSGTDWWIYDHNRVYVKVDGAFNYDTWIAGLRAGRTVVSNGPLLEFTAGNTGPGGTVNVTNGRIRVVASAVSRIPFERIEIVQNGRVVADQPSVAGREVRLERDLPVDEGGWIAARVTGGSKTYAGYDAFAHTSPVYLRVAGTSFRRTESVGRFMDEIERSKRVISKSFKFTGDAQRALAIGRFEEGRRAFGRLLGEAG